VPENLIGTLTSNILKSAYTLISPISFYKLCSVATPRHPEPLLLENHVRIVALTPDLQRVSFYNVTGFLYHSTTTELLLSLILIKGLIRALRPHTYTRNPSLALWLLWCENLGKVATQISTSAANFGLVRNSPARPHNTVYIYVVLLIM
jgi:hypothetical protein